MFDGYTFMRGMSTGRNAALRPWNEGSSTPYCTSILPGFLEQAYIGHIRASCQASVCEGSVVSEGPL